MVTDQFQSPPSIGTQLRDARQSKGLALAEIAGTLRIKSQFLEAIEADRLDALPSPTHASGFLRSYARYLGVDVAPTGLVPQPIPTPVTSTAPPLIELARFLPPLMVIGGLILVYALWQWLQPPVPTPIAPPPTDFISQGAAPKLEPLEPKIEPQAELKVEAVPAVTETAPAESPAATVATTSVKPVKMEIPKQETLTVRAVSDAWVQITDANGRQLYSRLMRAGESWRAPQQSGLRLSTGNAGGLVLVKGGEASAPLGAQAQVLRNLLLTQPVAVNPAATAKPAEPAPAESADEPTDLEE